MIKNKLRIAVLGLLILVLGLAFLSGVDTKNVKASEDSYEWGEVQCISIAPPYTYSANKTASFQLCFDKDITNANYKHLAAGATALKTFSRYDVPNMTTNIIDSLDESGVLDSINDCIAFNGVKIREMQKLSPIACMVMVGELGANNTMNIDFNGSVAGVKITDFNQTFTFTLYEGLKFPSGVELKETVTWVYNYQTRTFSQIPNESEENDADFNVYYNGQKITPENNLVTIYDRKAFSLDNFYVEKSSVSANVQIEPLFNSLVDGYNYVIITCTAEDKMTMKRIQVVFDLQQVTNVVAPKNNWVKLVLWIAIPVIVVCGATLTALLIVKARRKKSEK